MSNSKILWQPTAQQIANAKITQLKVLIEEQFQVTLRDYEALHAWSVNNLGDFWSLVWDQCGVKASSKGEQIVVNEDRMPGAQWFPQARLNYAENLLKKRGSQSAIVFRSENEIERKLSWDDLHDQVAAVAAHLDGLGLQPGDRIVGFMPNMPETIVAMLAAASLGAVWSSCSPDFGGQGVVDRFGQIEPKVLFTADGYLYNGKFHDSLGRVDAFLQNLPTIQHVVVVPFSDPTATVECSLANSVLYGDVINSNHPAEINFTQLPFDHPLYVMYSSGTTGAPKCIVHTAGGALLQHLKEMCFHCNLEEDDRIFYFTTCGWMMWNWLVSGLAVGATVMLYDGSPFYPDGNVILDYAAEEKFNVLGTSAKYIDALNKSGASPIDTHDLGSLRTLLSTGSPLSPEGFDYIYEKFKADICLSSISGGTDLLACFLGGNPTLEVRVGELQCRMLGMAVEVFDDQGQSLIGRKGELVCTRPFPSMPIGFWNDKDGSRYHNAYFDRFDNVWCHGDFVEVTSTGTAIIYGRSDTVLNPGGVRIGTAEIYRQVEQLAEIQESLVIGQQWQSDVRVVLFVRLSEGIVLDDALALKIKKQVRKNCTPRHVPAKIVAVADIPRTKSGKIVELAVRTIVHGESVNNREALANPDALALFENLQELQS